MTTQKKKKTKQKKAKEVTIDARLFDQLTSTMEDGMHLVSRSEAVLRELYEITSEGGAMIKAKYADRFAATMNEVADLLGEENTFRHSSKSVLIPKTA